MQNCRNFHYCHYAEHALAAHTAQTVKFMFSNVAYRPTVYKTGTRGGKQDRTSPSKGHYNCYVENANIQIYLYT